MDRPQSEGDAGYESSFAGLNHRGKRELLIRGSVGPRSHSPRPSFFGSSACAIRFDCLLSIMKTQLDLAGSRVGHRSLGGGRGLPVYRLWHSTADRERESQASSRCHQRRAPHPHRTWHSGRPAEYRARGQRSGYHRAMNAAGWRDADPLGFRSDVRIAVDTVSTNPTLPRR